MPATPPPPSPSPSRQSRAFTRRNLTMRPSPSPILLVLVSICAATTAAASADLFSNSFLVRFRRDVDLQEAHAVAERNGFVNMGPGPERVLQRRVGTKQLYDN
ncbi:hypothetical protein NQ318_000971 [Aromia moschata]|uniref:Peptidase S8 pro-domain domain-containing protein n=1 Tax=Aromia moschata TaxID=1265417 RepID=A0AAV8ZFT7_9CUCU|nr:hypothetical protein NQ318_000971 [Aromia moschata]